MKKVLIFFIITTLVVLTFTACQSEAATIICGNCSAKVSESSQYCPGCGARLFLNNGHTSTAGTSSSLVSQPPNPSNSTTASTAHVHSFSTATCTEPGICACGEIAENPLGHNWGAASCSVAATCTRCGATNGNALGHDWGTASCSSPATCTRCGASTGGTLGHDWGTASCSTAATCTRCGAINGNALGHNWVVATCTTAKTCSRCNKTEGVALGHSYAATKTASTCTTQGYTTYVCHCGDSYVADYIDPAHNYQKYICASCGQVDKSHAYEYLVEWVKKNGVASGEYIDFVYYSANNTRYVLSYCATGKYLYITTSSDVNGELFYCALYLNDHHCYMAFQDVRVLADIDPSEFTPNSPITNAEYQGNSAYKWDMIETTRLATCSLVDWLKWCLSAYNVGVTIADLGFTSW